MSGHFVGEVEVVWLSHAGADRNMRLLSDFSFVDAAGTRWPVPKGAVINGASIPKLLWTWGPPFVGDYRRASVVHDHYCVVRTRTAKSTHRMFYDGCRAGGVRKTKAKVMYTAVATFGPQWASVERLATAQEPAIAVTVQLSRSIQPDSYAQLLEWVEEENPTLNEIDQRIESMAPLVQNPVAEIR